MSGEESNVSETAQTNSNGNLASNYQSPEPAQAAGNDDKIPVVGDDIKPGQRMIFSGPNQLRHHRVTVPENFFAIGIGERSPEFTSEISYLNRNAPGTPFPKPRNCHVGEIGWPAEYFQNTTGTETCVILNR